MKPILLYNDTAKFERYKSIENDLKLALSKLKNIADKSLGYNSIDNLKTFVATPTNYIVNRYWEKYGSAFNPENSDLVEVYERNNKWNVATIDLFKSDFDLLHKRLGEYAPTLTAKDIKYNVKKPIFDVYLSEDKRSHYECLERFLSVSQELRTYEKCQGDISLMRYAPQNLRVIGLDVQILKDQFRENN